MSNGKQPSIDIYELTRAHINQDFSKLIAVKKPLTNAQIKKPDKQTWFAISPNPEHRITMPVIEIKEKREYYLVHPAIAEELTGEWSMQTICLCQARSGSYFWWPARLPDDSGQSNSWSTSAINIIAEFQNRWMRLLRNQEKGCYEVLLTDGAASPEWTDEAPSELINRNFKDRLVQAMDHPVVKMLQGRESC